MAIQAINKRSENSTTCNNFFPYQKQQVVFLCDGQNTPKKQQQIWQLQKNTNIFNVRVIDVLGLGVCAENLGRDCISCKTNNSCMAIWLLLLNEILNENHTAIISWMFPFSLQWNWRVTSRARASLVFGAHSHLQKWRESVGDAGNKEINVWYSLFWIH